MIRFESQENGVDVVSLLSGEYLIDRHIYAPAY